jgi:hypothetical protein
MRTTSLPHPNDNFHPRILTFHCVMNQPSQTVILTAIQAKYSENQTSFIHGFHTACQTIFTYVQPKILYGVTSNLIQQLWCHVEQDSQAVTPVRKMGYFEPSSSNNV